MFRLIENDLLAWKDQLGRMPLLVRGARQIGKSFVIEKFGRENFQNCVVVNLEENRDCISSFKTMDPFKITASLSAYLQQDIHPGETLLFIDEIQECPDAIMALRYFKEKMPELHVIAAGSLLEFVLNQPGFRMPVGRVESLYMYPCSFLEFLIATKSQQAIDYLSQVTLSEGIDEAVHVMLLEKVREYFIVGGMPAVLAHFIEHQDYNRVQTLQGSLRDSYRSDFGKYDKHAKVRHLLTAFDKIPSLVGKQFKYAAIDREVQSRDLKPVIKGLDDAGLIHVVYHTSASGLPLNAVINEKRFKLLFVDVGLLKSAGSLSVDELFNEELITLNQGALAEQFVGQELCALSRNYEKANVYYWEREKKPSIAEVDYVIHVDSKILPVEVKSGKTGRLKSLKSFLQEKGAPFGVRVSGQALSFEDGVLSMPFYMLHELERLVRSML